MAATQSTRVQWTRYNNTNYEGSQRLALIFLVVGRHITNKYESDCTDVRLGLPTRCLFDCVMACRRLVTVGRVELINTQSGSYDRTLLAGGVGRPLACLTASAVLLFAGRDHWLDTLIEIDGARQAECREHAGSFGSKTRISLTALQREVWRLAVLPRHLLGLLNHTGDGLTYQRAWLGCFSQRSANDGHGPCCEEDGIRALGGRRVLLGLIIMCREDGACCKGRAREWVDSGLAEASPSHSRPTRGQDTASVARMQHKAASACRADSVLHAEQ